MLVCWFIPSRGWGSHTHSAYTEVSAECVSAVLSRAGGVGKGQNSQANRVPGCFASSYPSTKGGCRGHRGCPPRPLHLARAFMPQDLHLTASPISRKPSSAKWEPLSQDVMSLILNQGGRGQLTPRPDGSTWESQANVVRITGMDVVTAWVCCWPYGSLETANRKWYPSDKNTWEANNM